MINFQDFIKHLVVEELHPELQTIVKSPTGRKSKQSLLAKTIKTLTSRGEKTGIEGNMPEGSSRAYLKHEEPHKITLDGKPNTIPTGIKVAIKADLDKYHDRKKHDNLKLGAMQNRAEGNDHWVNQNYRILSKDNSGNFHSNKESGIFPPLIDHDHEHHEWSHVGHARDIKGEKEFKDLSKTESHPEGISHRDFVDSLNRFHNRNNGRHHKLSQEQEKHLDHIDNHPLVQAFTDYHGNTGNPPTDYEQLGNLGIFHHPDGSKHIVARDHGFDSDVQSAYTQARKKQMAKYEHLPVEHT